MPTAESGPTTKQLRVPAQRTSRRTVLRAAAWSVPVVAGVAAAPAYAASARCLPQRLLWSTYAGRDLQDQTVTGIGDPASPTTVMITASGGTGTPGNLVASTELLGDQRSNLPLQVPRFVVGSENVTLTFSAPVTDLGFTLLGIDSSNTFDLLSGTGANHDDTITLTPGFTFTRAGAVKGNGTGRPFRPRGANSPVAAGSTDGNVDIVYAGPITSVTITYAQTVRTQGTRPVVGLGDLSFTGTHC